MGASNKRLSMEEWELRIRDLESIVDGLVKEIATIKRKYQRPKEVLLELLARK